MLVNPLLGSWRLCWKSCVEFTVPPGVAGGVKDGESKDAGTPGVISTWSCSVLLAGLARSWGRSGLLLPDSAPGRTGRKESMPLTASLEEVGRSDCGERKGET